MSTVTFDLTEEDKALAEEASALYDATEAGATEGNETQKSEDQVETLMLMERRRRRFQCSDMTPYVARVAQEPERKKNKTLDAFKAMLSKAKVDKVTEKLKYLSDFDRSEAIIPHGQVSKKLFEEVFHRRPYDMYGRMQDKNELTEDKEAQMVAVARSMGLTYESDAQKADKAERKAIISTLPDPYDRDNLYVGGLKPPKITTDIHNLGWIEVDSAPPGFAENPAPLPMSHGNEVYFSYDGSWKGGKMNGFGEYKYEDDTIYRGEWKDNHREGEGTSRYANGSEYSGGWVHSKYEGLATQILWSDISEYRGTFRDGRRSGTGKLVYRCGLKYEGQFMDGKPHGRGTMASDLTGYRYEGSFKNGGIAGSGALFTPPPESKRIVRYWPKGHRSPNLLGDCVKWYLEDKETQRYNDMMAGQALFGMKRSLKLKQYVEAVRKEIHDERFEAKKAAREEALRKWKEQKEKLHEAKMRALAGIESDDEEEDDKKKKKKKSK